MCRANIRVLGYLGPETDIFTFFLTIIVAAVLCPARGSTPGEPSVKLHSLPVQNSGMNPCARYT
jgi:hypothetical protein